MFRSLTVSSSSFHTSQRTQSVSIINISHGKTSWMYIGLHIRCNFCQISTKIGMYGRILVTIPNTKFNKNPSSVCPDIPCRCEEVTSLLATILWTCPKTVLTKIKCSHTQIYTYVHWAYFDAKWYTLVVYTCGMSPQISKTFVWSMIVIIVWYVTSVL